MRKLASIVTIGQTYPIEDSDRLSVAIPKGTAWRIVTARDEFKVGDLAVYFEIDSALPPDDPRYAFLVDKTLRKFKDKRGNDVRGPVLRIRTIKLRGVISQGLLMPVSLFPEAEGKAVGDDLTDELHVQHFDDILAEVQAILDTSTPAGTGKRAGNFPWFVPKTDEERIQNLADWCDTMKGVEWEATLKMDGSSFTAGWSATQRQDKNPFFVCSRNFELARGEGDSAWWEAADKNDLENRLATFCTDNDVEIAIQAELVGPGMNGNRDQLQERDIYVFRIWDIKAQCWLPVDDRIMTCEALGLKHVPILRRRMDVFTELPTVDDILKFAEGKTASGHEREGVVFKEEDTVHPRSFKAVSNAYLLKIK